MDLPEGEKDRQVSAISLRDLRKTYGSTEVVKGVNLDVSGQRSWS